MMSQIHILKYFFKKKQSDDLATLPVHTCSETWILHSITWYMPYTHQVIVDLKFFPVDWNTCIVWDFLASPSGILAYISSDQIPILPMKHSLSIIFCLLLHMFCISHFLLKYNFSPCLKQTIPTWFGGLSHTSQYSLFI